MRVEAIRAIVIGFTLTAVALLAYHDPPPSLYKQTPGQVFCTVTASEAGIAQTCERVVAE